MTLRTRLALAAALIAAIVLVISGFLIIRLTQRDQRQQLDSDLVQQAQTVAGPVSRLATSGIAGELRRSAAGGVDGDRTIRVMDRSSGAVTLTMGLPLPGPLGLLSAGLSTHTIGGRAYRIETINVLPRPGGPNRVFGRVAAPAQVQLLAPLASTRAAARAIHRRVLFIGAGAFIAIVLVSLVVIGSELRPLRQLADVARRIGSDDDLAVRAPPHGPPEVQTVSQAFNEMLDRIQASAATRQQALEAARSFAADAAHELRTPLTSMSANLELLAAGGPADRSVIDALASDHARIAGTLEALHALTVGDLSAASEEPVDLADLIELAARDTGRHPRLRLTVDAPQDQVLVRGDRESLRMVIDNLLTNAERHARLDGDTAVALTLDREGNSWRLSVDDDGVGFPAEGVDQLLDRFARGPTSAAGSGLGLAIVAQQVRRHGGSIALRRSPLGGAGIDIRLPAAPPEPKGS